MAKAYKCDSCGRYFRFGNHNQLGDYYCGRYINPSVDIVMPVRTDLCSECYKEFSEFMTKFLNNPSKRMGIYKSESKEKSEESDE